MKNKFDGIEDRHIRVLEERYMNLIRSIAYKIGGDRVGADIDDCHQELFLAAMEAMEAFRRLQYPELSYDEILELPGFGKYVKSCLWHKKGKVGALITKKIINGPIKKRFSEMGGVGRGDLESFGDTFAIAPPPSKETCLNQVPRDGSTGRLLTYMLENIEDVLYLDYSAPWVAGIARQLKEKPHRVSKSLRSLKARIEPYLKEEL